MDLYFVSALSAGEITALDAAVASASIATATTNAFQFWESNPGQATLLETWQTALQQTAQPVSGGIYRLSWYFELRIVPTGPVNSAAVGRFSVDSVVKGSSHYALTEWHACSGWDRLVLEEGETPVLEIGYRRDPVEGGNDSVEIRKVKLGIELMG
jgi:hypothetical protein